LTGGAYVDQRRPECSPASAVSNEERRNFVGRARAIDENGRIRSIIVKATRSPSYNPAAADALENSGLVREWVAAAYIAARAPGRGHGSAFLSGDVSRGFVIFEDLGTDLARSLIPFSEELRKRQRAR
jgi:hypothetical protein